MRYGGARSTRKRSDPKHVAVSKREGKTNRASVCTNAPHLYLLYRCLWYISTSLVCHLWYEIECYLV